MKVLPFQIFNSVWSALEDVIIWLLPLPVVWGLKVSVQRKMGLYFLLGVSLISVVCAVARLVVTIIWLRSIDISWNYPLIPFFSNVEACIAIMTSSVPAIQPLFRGPLKQQRLESKTSQYRLNPSAGGRNGQGSNVVVPSTANERGGRSNQNWSLFRRLKKASSGLQGLGLTGQRQLPTFNMQAGMMEMGPRTELKDLEEDEEINLVPGLGHEKALRMR